MKVHFFSVFFGVLKCLLRCYIFTSALGDVSSSGHFGDVLPFRCGAHLAGHLAFLVLIGTCWTRHAPPLVAIIVCANTAAHCWTGEEWDWYLTHKWRTLLPKKQKKTKTCHACVYSTQWMFCRVWDKKKIHIPWIKIILSCGILVLLYPSWSPHKTKTKSKAKCCLHL